MWLRPSSSNLVAIREDLSALLGNLITKVQPFLPETPPGKVLSGPVHLKANVTQKLIWVYGTNIYTKKPKVFGHLAITHICSSSPNCCHNVESTQLYSLSLYAVVLQFVFTGPKRSRSCSSTTMPMCTKRALWRHGSDLKLTKHVWNKLEHWSCSRTQH